MDYQKKIVCPIGMTETDVGWRGKIHVCSRIPDFDIRPRVWQAMSNMTTRNQRMCTCSVTAL
jgi:hypothetical protein